MPQSRINSLSSSHTVCETSIKSSRLWQPGATLRKLPWHQSMKVAVVEVSSRQCCPPCRCLRQQSQLQSQQQAEPFH